MRLSIAFTGFGTLPPTIDIVRKAEALGFDGAWSAEHLGFHDGIVPTAAYAGVTDHLSLGIVGLSPASRHPGALAMEVMSLRELAPGRLRLAVGTGDPSLVAKLGKSIDRPITSTRSFVTALRETLAGRSMTVEQPAFRFEAFKLSSAGEVPPIDIMAIRPRMIELACEIGDGISLSVGGSLDYLADTVAEVEAHLERLGRDRGSFRITALTVASIAEDLSVARAPIPGMMAMGPPESLGILAKGVLDVEEVLAAAKGGMFSLMKLMTPEVIDATALTATPGSLADRLKAFAATGIDELGILPLGDPDTTGSVLELLADNRP